MIKSWKLNYFTIALSIIIIDRITKWFALYYCITQPLIFNHFVSCEVAINRGISWGLLQAPNTTMFALTTSMIIAITGGVAWYAYMRWHLGNIIVGEVCIIAGSLSNIIDRFVYHGVVDFILLHYNAWSWPVFNCADMSIIIGVFLMFIEQYKNL